MGELFASRRHPVATNRQIKTKTETKVCVRTCALFALSHVIFFILFFVFRSLSVVSVLWWCAGARPSFKQFVKQCNEEAEAVAMKITFCNDEVTGDRMYALVSTPVLCSFIVVCLLCLLLCLSISPFTPWLPRSFVAVDGRSTPAQTKQLKSLAPDSKNTRCRSSTHWYRGCCQNGCWRLHCKAIHRPCPSSSFSPAHSSPFSRFVCLCLGVCVVAFCAAGSDCGKQWQDWPRRCA